MPWLTSCGQLILEQGVKADALLDLLDRHYCVSTSIKLSSTRITRITLHAGSHVDDELYLAIGNSQARLIIPFIPLDDSISPLHGCSAPAASIAAPSQGLSVNELAYDASQAEIYSARKAADSPPCDVLSCRRHAIWQSQHVESQSESNKPVMQL